MLFFLFVFKLQGIVGRLIVANNNYRVQHWLRASQHVHCCVCQLLDGVLDAALDHFQILSLTLFMFVQLEAFLTQRMSEMGEEGDVVAMSQFQLAPSVIQGQSQEHIREMMSEVRDLLGRLTSLRMQHLFMIQASPRYAAITNSKGQLLSVHYQCSVKMYFFLWFRYVERVSEVLRQKMKQADILVLKGATMVEKRQEVLEELARLEPRTDLLAGCTRELQKLV